MLRLCDFDRRFGRREFLRVGGLTLGGLALSDLLAARSAAAQSGRLVTDKSVILLFLHGGPSQFETFDPKMSAPAEVRSVTDEVATRIPGVTFGGTFPRLASLADKLTVVRSFTTGDANHDIKPIVCRDSLGANIGSIYSRVAGSNHPATGIPTNVALYPQAIDTGALPAVKNFGDFEATGALGKSVAPFVPAGKGEMQQAMRLELPLARLDDRRAILRQVDRLRWGADAGGLSDGVDRLREQAFRVILGSVADAFDVNKEDAATLARYDTSRLIHPDSISKRWNNNKNYRDHTQTLGKLLLLARRLCEAGCGFVTVTTSFVWDMHADDNNAGVAEGMGYMGLPLDYALSALFEDLAARGLDDRILVVVCGEMGRTPRLNARGGRDHWGNLAPLLLYGGGLPKGQVIGQSTRDGGEPLAERVTIKNLLGTILHTLLDTGEVRVAGGVPTEINRLLAEAEPIAGLMS
ncbi:MAG TPA: DUF1501 domain-containing protein [Pirellulales bacterium]|nr:DUF1501 domain-containing protein [Pirellulales bacterium]